jgi:type IV pilus assembly protein PilM
MGFFQDVFSPQSRKPIVGIDIGTQNIKCAEIEFVPNGRPKILALGSVKTPEGSISGTNIQKSEYLCDAIIKLLESSQIDTKRVAFSLPSSSVFTKRINLPASSIPALASNIYFEASNYIPHRMDAIHLDYQVLQDNGSTVEVLLVAIKNEIINSFQNLFVKAGLEPIIADVECFSMLNCYSQLMQPSDPKNIAIIDIGARVISITLLSKGLFLISGDVSVSGKSYSDAIAESLQITPEKAENAKLGQQGTGVDSVLLGEIVDRTNEYACSEIQRQLTYLSNGVGLDGGVNKILLTGGAARIPRLVDELSQKLSVPVEFFNPVKGFDLAEQVDPSYASDELSGMGVALGLSLRRSNDKLQ